MMRYTIPRRPVPAAEAIKLAASLHALESGMTPMEKTAIIQAILGGVLRGIGGLGARMGTRVLGSRLGQNIVGRGIGRGLAGAGTRVAGTGLRFLERAAAKPGLLGVGRFAARQHLGLTRPGAALLGAVPRAGAVPMAITPSMRAGAVQLEKSLAGAAAPAAAVDMSILSQGARAAGRGAGKGADPFAKITKGMGAVPSYVPFQGVGRMAPAATEAAGAGAGAAAGAAGRPFAKGIGGAVESYKDVFRAGGLNRLWQQQGRLGKALTLGMAAWEMPKVIKGEEDPLRAAFNILAPLPAFRAGGFAGLGAAMLAPSISNRLLGPAPGSIPSPAQQVAEAPTQAPINVTVAPPSVNIMGPQMPQPTNFMPGIRV